MSIVVKEWLYGYSIKVGKDINSSSIVANAWHHRSDVFSSIGVMLGIAGAILCGEKWRVLDPLAAVIVSFFIIKASLSMVFSYANELVEVSLGEDIESKILEIVKNVPRVIRPHNLKTRKIGNNISIDLHIKVDKLLNIVEAHDICSQVEKELRNEFGKGTFISVHAEPLM